MKGNRHVPLINISVLVILWGYKKGISSETLLLYLTEKRKSALDDKKVTGALFIDFGKALDIVCQSILNHKLHAIGVSGAINELLMNYLKDRRQYVKVNGEKSELREVDIGIPQGLILGPCLFAIYVNDFPTAIQVGELQMYADDATAFVIANTVDEAIHYLNIITDEINGWCFKNRLTIHCDKTEAMLITRTQICGPLLPIKIGEQVIKYVETTKCLGFIIDNHLKWQYQIDAVCKSYAAKVKKLNSLEFLPSRMLEDIYFKTIIPSVTYCTAVRGTSSDAGFKRLEHIHARAVRTVKHPEKGPWDDEIVKKAGWQSLSFLYKKRMLIIMSDGINERTDKRLKEMIMVPNKLTNNKLTLQKPRTEIGRMTMKFRGTILWNSLSNEDRDIKSKNTFKERLKKLKEKMNNTTFEKGTTTTRFRNDNYVYF